MEAIAIRLEAIATRSKKLLVAKGIATSNIRLAHLAKSTMAAPSVTWLLLPAVVLPPALKALVNHAAKTRGLRGNSLRSADLLCATKAPGVLNVPLLPLD